MSKSGFTTIEMVIAVVIMGVVAAMAFPRIRDTLEAQKFRSARAATVSYLAMARAAAVARGCRSSLHFVSGQNSRMWVTSCQSGLGGSNLRDTLAGPEWTEDRWGVRLQSGKDSITYDPRGLRLTPTRTWILFKTKGDVTRDSVVVNELGKVMSR